MKYKFTLVFPKTNIEQYKTEIIKALTELLFHIISIHENKKIFIINKVRSGDLDKDTCNLIVVGVNELLCGNGVKDVIFYESTLPDSKVRALWKDIYMQFNASSNKSSTIANLIGDKNIDNFENYTEKEINDCIIVQIDIHSECSQLVDHIKETGDFGHLIINTPENSPYLEALRRTNYYETISVINTSKSKNVTVFDPRKNLMRIEVTGKTTSPLHSWTQIYLDSTKSFFSYSTEDDFDCIMDDFNKCISRYFPFIRKIHKDKDINNHHTDINKYVDELVNGSNLLFFFIGENYLKSFYSTQELLKTFERYELINKTEDELKNNNSIKNLIENGRFILIQCSETANKIRAMGNNEIKEHWEEERKKNTKLTYDDTQIAELIEKIDSIKNVLRALNTPIYICKYYEERYRSLVMPIAEALARKNPWLNIYTDHHINDIPDLSNLDRFKPNSYIKGVLCGDFKKVVKSK
ncbi:MAG: hypothetical protein WAT29_16940 [Thiolinea sp.]